MRSVEILILTILLLTFVGLIVRSVEILILTILLLTFVGLIVIAALC